MISAFHLIQMYLGSNYKLLSWILGLHRSFFENYGYTVVSKAVQVEEFKNP
jgi:hypothetical protein